MWRPKWCCIQHLVGRWYLGETEMGRPDDWNRLNIRMIIMSKLLCKIWLNWDVTPARAFWSMGWFKKKKHHGFCGELTLDSASFWVDDVMNPPVQDFPNWHSQRWNVLESNWNVHYFSSGGSGKASKDPSLPTSWCLVSGGLQDGWDRFGPVRTSDLQPQLRGVWGQLIFLNTSQTLISIE